MLKARASACEIGLLGRADVLPDRLDEVSTHAMVLDGSGNAIGCARIRASGKLERVAVLPQPGSEEVVGALKLAALLHGRAPSPCI